MNEIGLSIWTDLAIIRGRALCTQHSFSEYLVNPSLIASAFCFQGIKDIFVDFDAYLLLDRCDTIPFRVGFMRKPGS